MTRIGHPLALRDTTVYPLTKFRTAARRFTNCRVGTMLAVIVAIFLGGCATAYTNGHWPLVGNEVVCALGFSVASAVAALIALLFGSAWLGVRRHYLRCSHCRGRLTDRVPQVLASGCCHHCGQQVLDREDEPSGEPLIPRADFLAAEAKHQRRVGPFMLAAIAATFVGCVVGSNVINRLDLPNSQVGSLLMLLLLTAPVLMVLVLRWMAAGAKRDPSLACPECVQPLTGAGMLVAGTGHCFRCGGQAIPPRHAPLPPPHAGTWWTVDRLKEADARRRRITRRALALIVVVFVVTLWVLSVGERWWDDRVLASYRLDRSLATWAPLTIAIIAILTGAVVNRAASRQIQREGLLDCPRCGGEVQSSFAIATKCCNKCGWRVVSDPERAHGNKSATRTTAPGRANGDTLSAEPKVRCVRVTPAPKPVESETGSRNTSSRRFSKSSTQ